MVERKPSKLDVRVRFPSPAPDSGARHVGPCSSVVERSLGKGEVASSILAMGTMWKLMRLRLEKLMKSAAVKMLLTGRIHRPFIVFHIL